ncbi:MAG: hypothetical protein R2873_32765 [Caldilineaceae bacterium]
MLAMKARLNLFASPQYAPPSPAELATFQSAAQSLADKSMTALRGAGDLKLDIAPGSRVLTVTVGHLMPHMGIVDLEVFDNELSARLPGDTPAQPRQRRVAPGRRRARCCLHQHGQNPHDAAWHCPHHRHLP